MNANRYTFQSAILMDNSREKKNRKLCPPNKNYYWYSMTNINEHTLLLNKHWNITNRKEKKKSLIICVLNQSTQINIPIRSDAIGACFSFFFLFFLYSLMVVVCRSRLMVVRSSHQLDIHARYHFMWTSFHRVHYHLNDIIMHIQTHT